MFIYLFIYLFIDERQTDDELPLTCHRNLSLNTVIKLEKKELEKYPWPIMPTKLDVGIFKAFRLVCMVSKLDPFFPRESITIVQLCHCTITKDSIALSAILSLL